MPSRVIVMTQSCRRQVRTSTVSTMADFDGGDTTTPVGSSEELAIDVDGDEETSFWDNEAQIRRHLVFNALDGKKFRPLSEKQKLLARFLKLDPKTVFRKGSSQLDMAERVVKTLKQTGKTEPQQKRNWKQPFVASMLTGLYLLHDEHVKALTSNNGPTTRPPKAVEPFKALINFMEKLEAEAKAQATAAQQAGRQSRSFINKQSTGSRVQDGIPFLEDNADRLGCAVCGHMYCQPIETKEEIDRQNAKIVQEHESKMAEWEAKPTESRGKKPSMKPTKSQTIACYCYSMHCMHLETGEGCLNCELHVKNGESTLESVYEDDGDTIKMQCRCAVCKCTCQAKYDRNKRQAVALEAASKRADVNSTEGVVISKSFV